MIVYVALSKNIFKINLQINIYPHNALYNNFRHI